jgi:hypothetical protein
MFPVSAPEQRGLPAESRRNSTTATSRRIGRRCSTSTHRNCSATNGPTPRVRIDGWSLWAGVSRGCRWMSWSPALELQPLFEPFITFSVVGRIPAPFRVDTRHRLRFQTNGGFSNSPIIGRGWPEGVRLLWSGGCAKADKVVLCHRHRSGQSRLRSHQPWR